MKTFTTLALAVFASMVAAMPVPDAADRAEASTVTRHLTVTEVVHVEAVKTVWVDPTSTTAEATATPTRRPAENNIEESDDEEDIDEEPAQRKEPNSEPESKKEEEEKEEDNQESDNESEPETEQKPAPAATTPPPPPAEPTPPPQQEQQQQQEEEEEEEQTAPPPPSSGGSFTGIASYYTEYTDGHAGSCGTTTTDKNFMGVALTIDKMQASMVDGNPNNAKLCGKQIKVWRGNKSVVCTVVDSCPGCKSADGIDLTPAAFNALGSESEGVFEVKWEFI